MISKKLGENVAQLPSRYTFRKTGLRDFLNT